jgi:hypothetical protein
MRLPAPALTKLAGAANMGMQIEAMPRFGGMVVRTKYSGMTVMRPRPLPRSQVGLRHGTVVYGLGGKFREKIPAHFFLRMRENRSPGKDACCGSRRLSTLLDSRERPRSGNLSIGIDFNRSLTQLAVYVDMAQPGGFGDGVALSRTSSLPRLTGRSVTYQPSLPLSRTSSERREGTRHLHVGSAGPDSYLA